jgi:Amidohydrolase family
MTTWPPWPRRPRQPRRSAADGIRPFGQAGPRAPTSNFGVGAPPLRERSDREALWAGLAASDVDTLCSDHAPWTLDAELDPALNAVTARQGVADLETLMPMLCSEGVLAGRISHDPFVALTSANAAGIFGLYPRMGTIAVGSDADIALWDLRHRRTIDGAHAIAFRLFGVRRLAGAGLAEIRRPPRPARARRRPDHSSPRRRSMAPA